MLRSPVLSPVWCRRCCRVCTCVTSSVRLSGVIKCNSYTTWRCPRQFPDLITHQNHLMNFELVSQVLEQNREVEEDREIAHNAMTPHGSMCHPLLTRKTKSNRCPWLGLQTVLTVKLPPPPPPGCCQQVGNFAFQFFSANISICLPSIDRNTYIRMYRYIYLKHFSSWVLNCSTLLPLDLLFHHSTLRVAQQSIGLSVGCAKVMSPSPYRWLWWLLPILCCSK